MLQFLLIPIVLLSLESPFQAGMQALLVASCAAIADNVWGIISAVLLVSFMCLIAVMINWRLVLSMFFDWQRTKDGRRVRWEWFRIMNWVCSATFLCSLVYLLSQPRLLNWRNQTLDESIESSIAMLVCFLTVTYLIAFFGVSMVNTDDDADDPAQRRPFTLGVSSFVPPLYYAGLVAVSFQLERSFLVRALIVLISALFFAGYVGVVLFRLKTARPAAPADKAQTDDEPQCKPAAPACEPSSAGDGHHRLIDVPRDIVRQQRVKEVLSDIAFYVVPAIGIAMAFPAAVPYVMVFSLIWALGERAYLLLAKRLWFMPTPLEDPEVAKQRLATYASPYPNGWYRLCASSDIPVGRAKYMHAVGLHLAVFRGHDGKARVLDAHCPHLGANIAVGGRVVGNCLECPFHRWQFDGDGVCTYIPYTDKIPKAANTSAYYVCEYYGHILFWYHAQRQEPDYLPPEVEPLATGNMVRRGATSTAVNMHIQEFAENSTDFQHFDPLHGQMTLPFSPIPIPLLKIQHRPTWKEGKGAEKHRCWFLDHADLYIAGHTIPKTDAHATINFIGPASLVYFLFETELGKIVLFQTHTPLAGTRQQVNFEWWADVQLPRALVFYVVGNWIAQWRNDIMVWENKIFANKPVLVKGDGPMNLQRRWFKQFYSTPLERPVGLEADDDGRPAAMTASAASELF